METTARIAVMLDPDYILRDPKKLLGQAGGVGKSLWTPSFTARRTLAPSDLRLLSWARKTEHFPSQRRPSRADKLRVGQLVFGGA